MRNIAFPFKIDSGGRTSLATDDAHVRDLIEQLLFTSPGERVNRPDFGTVLQQLVFGPNSPEVAAATQFLVQGAWGVIPAHLAELSPDSVRGFLPGFGYQCGVLLASSVTYIEAVFARRTSYAIAMAATAATVFVLAAIATAVGPERRAVQFGEGS